MASPLDHYPTFPKYWSEHPRDKAFGANCNAFSSKFTGFCICHPSYHENTMYIATRHAILCCSSTEATATFMFHPSWNERMTINPYSLYRRFPYMCKFLGSIPSYQLQYAEIPLWNNIQTPLPKHTWEKHVIAIRNTKGRNCLNACNKNWLKELAKEFPEAKWEINYIHNDPYPSALSIEKNPGHKKVKKLPNDHLHKTPQGLWNRNSTLDPPQSSDEATQHSSIANLTRKVQNWLNWTFTDGSL